MLKFKKIGLFLLGFMVFFGINLQFTQGLRNGLPRDHASNQNQFNQNLERSSTGKVGDTELTPNNPTKSGSKAMGDKTMGVLNLPQKNDYKSELGYALALIQIAVNRTIGILSFVVLIYILYNGFLILTSGADSKNAEKGKKGIKTATIAIIGIGISWLIISIIIWLIKSLAYEI